MNSLDALAAVLFFFFFFCRQEKKKGGFGYTREVSADSSDGRADKMKAEREVEQNGIFQPLPHTLNPFQLTKTHYK